MKFEAFRDNFILPPTLTDYFVGFGPSGIRATGTGQYKLISQCEDTYKHTCYHHYNVTIAGHDTETSLVTIKNRSIHGSDDTGAIFSVRNQWDSYMVQKWRFKTRFVDRSLSMILV